MRKKVNLVSLYIYPQIYHSAVKNGIVLGFSTYDSKIKSVNTIKYFWNILSTVCHKGLSDNP